MYRKNQHIHFVGIGGIGMSGIAELLLNLGYRVSGSDLRESRITRRLRELGGEINIGHDRRWIAKADVVVTSSAVKSDNPEVVAAHEALVPVIPRAEMLAELMRLKVNGIAVAGSHGKTSTTSMAGTLLAEAGLDPTVVIGGQVNSFGSNAKLGEGDFLVAEADESDGSFLKLSPVLEIVTNIDLEHVDHYHDLEAVKAAFLEFINRIPFYGAAILCLDDPNVAALLPLVRKRTITYGLSSQADVQAREIVARGFISRFEVWQRGRRLGQVTLAVPGRHNVYNALAVIALGLELEIPFTVIARALSTYSGVQRRLEVKGEVDGITVVDDYGHHPTEIRATLAAMREAWPKRRLVVLFQPHRYSRTAGLLQDFCTSFHDADLLLLDDIYAAGEDPIATVAGAALAQAIRRHGQKEVEYVPGLIDQSAAVMSMLRRGDVVLTLGAGNIWRLGESVLTALSAKDQAA
ncbi:UDP-N-acetylmuramate--L-alanine ligase [Desulfurivibrio dismutans]|uniref:UDP-N-acetylmuramate--L-alanine ligase n=1 Tax=Desulfurivibrio dismutans TaxID=1398908 RepID=UPI0023DC7DE4|nr:UDP-N-acetylmuramate--L-alanine ligase [Desulfurivibrio alkaliphilus]MDF1613430.1 UDP-N-acetylmuramate--L-alanine ligase [Desulfurivibrio alkaliphilus]